MDELIEIDRFDNIGIDAQLVPTKQVTFLPRGSQNDHRNSVQRRIGSYLAQHFEPVNFRHFDVKQHHGRMAARAIRKITAPEKIIQRLGAIADHVDVVRQVAFP